MSGFFNKVGKFGGKILDKTKDVGTNWVGYIESQGNNLVDKSKYVVDNTICGEKLTPKEFEILTKVKQLEEDEMIELVYTYNGRIVVDGNTLVCLTNLNLFKVQKGKLDQIKRSAITDVKYEKNNFASWDKIVCKLEGGQEEGFGIFHGKACAHFYECIQADIAKKRALALMKDHEDAKAKLEAEPVKPAEVASSVPIDQVSQAFQESSVQRVARADSQFGLGEDSDESDLDSQLEGQASPVAEVPQVVADESIVVIRKTPEPVNPQINEPSTPESH